MVISNTTYRFNADTKFVLVSEAGTKLVSNVVTGGVAYDAQAENTHNVFFICAQDSNTVKYAVVASTNELNQAVDFSTDLFYVAEADAELGDGYVVHKVYFADGTSDFLKIDVEDTDCDALADDTFYAYDKNEEGYYILDNTVKALQLADTTNNVWDEDEGVLTNAAFVDLYENLLSVTAGNNSFFDIDVASAKFVDVHDTDVGYDAVISSLSALNTLADKTGYTTNATLSVNVSEDGAVTVFLTALSHARNVQQPQ
jgi:hypothetical protein